MDDGSLILTRHKLNADDYFRMAEAGILGKGDRVELIDGEIIDMAPVGHWIRWSSLSWAKLCRSTAKWPDAMVRL